MSENGVGAEKFRSRRNLPPGRLLCRVPWTGGRWSRLRRTGHKRHDVPCASAQRAPMRTLPAGLLGRPVDHPPRFELAQERADLRRRERGRGIDPVRALGVGRAGPFAGMLLDAAAIAHNRVSP